MTDAMAIFLPTLFTAGIMGQAMPMEEREEAVDSTIASLLASMPPDGNGRVEDALAQVEEFAAQFKSPVELANAIGLDLGPEDDEEA